MTKTIITNNEKETRELGFSLAKIIPNGSVIKLTGDLGAGKTTLTRGIAEAFNITEKITSPTFNIMKIYMKGTKPLIHIDAYRLKDFNSDIGLDEYIGYESGITMIEWPEFIEYMIPENAIEVSIKHLGNDKREITIKGDINL